VGAHSAQCAESLNALTQRVAAASAEEIDQAILELQRVRDVLRREGEQVNRGLAGYASLNQHLMTGMKIIAENLNQWKGAPVRRSLATADFNASWA
jgi:ABC-type transporter Mla subunit MlaD